MLCGADTRMNLGKFGEGPQRGGFLAEVEVVRYPTPCACGGNPCWAGRKRLHDVPVCLVWAKGGADC